MMEINVTRKNRIKSVNFSKALTHLESPFFLDTLKPEIFNVATVIVLNDLENELPAKPTLPLPFDKFTAAALSTQFFFFETANKIYYSISSSASEWTLHFHYHLSSKIISAFDADNISTVIMRLGKSGHLDHMLRLTSLKLITGSAKSDNSNILNRYLMKITKSSKNGKICFSLLADPLMRLENFATL